MQKLFTSSCLTCLLNAGYTHFLLTTTCVDDLGADLCLTLIPVREEPDAHMLSEKFDGYYYLPEELSQMHDNDNLMLVIDLSTVKEVL